VNFLHRYSLVDSGLSKRSRNAAAQDMSLGEDVWMYRMTARTALSQV